MACSDVIASRAQLLLWIVCVSALLTPGKCLDQAQPNLPLLCPRALKKKTPLHFRVPMFAIELFLAMRPPAEPAAGLRLWCPPAGTAREITVTREPMAARREARRRACAKRRGDGRTRLATGPDVAANAPTTSGCRARRRSSREPRRGCWRLLC